MSRVNSSIIKKLFKSVLVFLLIAVTAFPAMACGGDNNTDDIPDDTIKGTGNYIIKDGVTDYKIVVPKQSLYEERYSASEIANYIEVASGVKMEIVTDEGLTLSADSKYISVGRTLLLAQAGVAEADIPDTQGFVIKTVNKSIVLVGGNGTGTMYASYEFLHRQVGFEAYASDEVYTHVNLKDVELLSFNLTDSPDIMWRQPNYAAVDYNIVAAQRMRFNPSIWMKDTFHWVHNAQGEFFPHGTYLSKHPDWYSDGKSNGKPYQLCYTAHGNEEELALMHDQFLSRLKTIVKKYFDNGEFLESISFTQEDNPRWCTCDACVASKATYGEDSATLIRFVNPVAVRFKEWLNEVYPGHNVNIAIFAYQPTENAPVTEVDGEFVANDPSVIPEDNVALFYAPYYADYYQSFEASDNKTYYNTMKKWASITDNLYFWFYSSCFFDNYFVWFDTFNSMQPIYQMSRDLGAYYLFDQGKYNSMGLSGFETLKIYLNSKLAWNVDANVQTLTNNFFNAYFGAASQPMQEYFQGFRVWMEYLRQNKLIDAGKMTNTALFSTTSLPKNVLLNWEQCINQAYEAIEPYKNDSTLYTKLHNRITSESMAIRYYLIDFYASTYTAEEVLEMKLQFKKDAEQLQFTLLIEYLPITDLWTKWKI